MRFNFNSIVLIMIGILFIGLGFGLLLKHDSSGIRNVLIGFLFTVIGFITLTK